MAKNAVLAGIMNFFLLGPGYIYSGKRVITGVLLTIGAILATYVELELKSLDTNLYWIMFVGFFSLAIGTTYDVVTEIRSEQQ